VLLIFFLSLSLFLFSSFRFESNIIMMHFNTNSKWWWINRQLLPNFFEHFNFVNISKVKFTSRRIYYIIIDWICPNRFFHNTTDGDSIYNI
jgi:hypothetical protein